MKVIDAIWEQKNLGKRTIEVTIEKKDINRDPSDVYTEIEEAEEKYKSEYTVVKMKSGNLKIGFELQKNNFLYVENQIIMRGGYDDLKCAVENYKDIYYNTKQEEIESEKDIRYIQKEIKKGIFKTDRIALDPFFGVETANNRYANWVRDEYDRGSHVAYILVDSERVAFVVYREKGTVHTGLLSGVFQDYADGNYGGCILYAASASMIESGISVAHAAVSGNNPVIVGLHEMFGCRIRSFMDVYIRHK